MKKVLLYKSELLHISETFIREQILSYTDWSATLVGTRRVPGLSLDGLDIRLLDDPKPGRAARIYARLLRRLDAANPRAVRLLRSEAAMLVHVHFGTDAVDFWPIVRRLRLPMVVTLHGYDITTHRAYWEGGAGGPARALYPGRLVKMAQSPWVHFIAVSEAIKQRAIDYGIPADRIRVEYIGIDPSLFRADGPPLLERRPRILYVGRLVEKKGVAYLIEAFSQVRAHVPDAELVIVGDGPLRQQLETLASQVAVPVQFAGSMERDGIRRQLDEARVFCLPSVTAQNGDAEGFGLVLLEAQASGIPVVTSAQGGAQEGIIEGITGLSFTERDTNALARHLTTLLTDDERLARMSIAAREFVGSKFDLHACTRSLERTYDAICDMSAASTTAAR